jgi:tetratricopeptide (TPR) repeat protein
MYEKVQGDDPRVANLLNRLGIVYGDLKETDKEINCYLRSIAMYERLYADKPDDAYAYVLNNLGITYKDLKQFTQAIEYYERAHKMFEQLYGVAHAKTKETSEGVSFCRMNAAPSSSSSSSTIRTAVSKLDLKDFEGKESLKLMLEQAQEALRSDPEGLQALIEQYVDKPHVDTAATLDNVGRSYHILKDYAQARGYYELSLAMYEKQVEGDNSEIASLLSRLGIVYDKLGEGDKKINCFLRSIAMYEKLYVDKLDDDYATALKNLGVTYKDLKQFTQAIEYLERSHKIFEQLYGPNHIKTRKASGWASFCRMKLQDPQKPSSSSS